MPATLAPPRSPDPACDPASARLQATGVSFAYGPAPVLEGVTLGVERGGLLGLIGPNGSGKTTLLKILAGMLSPDRGEVRLDGRPLSSLMRRDLARHVAVVPQETQLAFEYSVLEMVLMGRHPHLGTFELEGPRDLAIAREALAATGTTELERRAFSTLSGGEKQRVVIASALAQSADLLLLDEPTASLDLRYQLEVAGLLQRLNRERGVTIVLSTHDLNFAASLCRTLVLLRDGRVLASGDTSAVLTRESIVALYDVDADVHFHDVAGHVTVVPLSVDSRRSSGDSRADHE
jgi:iron complex transport system ATP-binding protein